VARDQKKAEQEERTIVWIDQTGFYLLPFVVHTYAPKGKTPILRAPLSKDHLSVISAITPAGRVLLHTQERAYRSPDIVRFLKHLLHHIPGKLLVIWDGSPIHRGEPVKQFLANGGAERIHLEPLPAYAPDLNPDEGVWNYLKRVELRNLCCANLPALRRAFWLAVARLRRRPHIVQACIKQVGLDV